MSQHEFEIIERYFKVISSTADGVVLGPGDDCAILSFAPDDEVCTSTDTLIAGVHLPLDCDAAMAASRMVGANLSDLAAMGAKPHSCLIAMTMPDVDAAWLESFSASLSQLLSRYEIALVGGNLARGDLSLSMTVLGTVPRGKAVRRDGATPNQDIYVTGTLGDAGQGLKLVLDNPAVSGFLAGRYAQPIPRLEVGKQLQNMATAMIDISDGLLADLGHLCQASQIGAVVEFDAIPLSDELVQAIQEEAARQLALSAGDDYELCFTANASDATTIQKIADECQVSITRIGQTVSNEKIDVVDSNGKSIDLMTDGYKHF